MTEHPTKPPPLKPGEGRGGCLGLFAGLGAMALLAFALTGVGYFVAHWLGWL